MAGLFYFSIEPNIEQNMVCVDINPSLTLFVKCVKVLSVWQTVF